MLEIERNNQIFWNAPRPQLLPSAVDDEIKRQAGQGTGLRTLVHMDDPDHRVIRAIGADWLRPKAMRALERGVRTPALVKGARAAGGVQDAPSCHIPGKLQHRGPLVVRVEETGLVLGRVLPPPPSCRSR